MSVMMPTNKEVNFYQYCPQCKHEKKLGTEEPCNSCLHDFFNQHSHKPVKFEPKKDERPRTV